MAQIPAAVQTHKLTPGIDLLVPVSETIYFDQVAYDSIIASPTANVSELLDIAFSFRLQHIGDPPLYPDNVHIYLKSGKGTIDITSAVMAEVRGLLNEKPPAELTKQYLNGLADWIDLIKDQPTVVGYDKDQVNQIESAAHDAAKNDDLVGSLKKIGDRSAGAGGWMHLSNFIYSNISLPPIRMGNILSRLNKGQADQMTLKSLWPFDFLVSFGSLRSKTANWKRTDHVRGALKFGATYFFSNELLPEFEDLEHKLKTRLLEINTKLSASGDIQQSIATLNDHLLKIRDAAASLTKVDGDTLKQLSLLQAKVDSMVARVVAHL